MIILKTVNGGGQFKTAEGGQFETAKGGQFERHIQ